MKSSRNVSSVKKTSLSKGVVARVQCVVDMAESVFMQRLAYNTAVQGVAATC